MAQPWAGLCRTFSPPPWSLHTRLIRAAARAHIGKAYLSTQVTTALSFPSLVTANDEGHGFRKKGNQDFQFYAMVQFMREFLLE
jgi:hypothetical protein